MTDSIYVINPAPARRLYERNPVLFTAWSYGYWIRQIVGSAARELRNLITH